MRVASVRFGLACIGLAALAAGCAGPQSPPPSAGAALPSAAPPPGAASGPVPVDGTYLGARQFISSSNAGVLCGSRDDMTVTIRGRMLHYVLPQPEVPYMPTRAFDAPVDKDGFFSAASGAAYMRGQVGNGHMQGSMSGDACAYQFQADRSGP
ncbi:MAG: hypothetical protein JSR21_17995 [Proteobacteria bacterium]|nr:hypothetical protein [Pseudomonadota bacterium]